MTRLTAIIIAALTALCATAVTPKEIPNVQKMKADRWVSDPAGFLTSEELSRVDAAIDRINRANTTEICAVIVPDLSGQEIGDFATELFELWQIGRKDSDNGLLILISLGDREATIRTGDGMEIAVTDGRAGQIIRHDIAPAMKQGNPEKALLAAVNSIGIIVEDPAYFDDLHSDIAAKRTRGGEAEHENFFRNYLIIAAILTLLMLAWVISIVIRSRKLDPQERYSRLDKLRLPTLMLVALSLGMAIVVFIPLWLMLRHIRLRRHNCPNCGTRMHRVDEVHDNDYLTPAQDMEERLNSVDYDVWLCPNCNETDIIPYVNKRSSFKVCPACGARADALQAYRIIKQPTTTSEGIGQHDYRCHNCGNVHSVAYSIAKLVQPPIIVGGGGRGFGGGGGFSGGGFGGGTTSGGGATGGW